MVYKEGEVYKPRIKEHICVKEAVFPFKKLAGADLILGPEMKSTGEVMGISDTFALSFAKSQCASGNRLPDKGKVFISLTDIDKKFTKELGQKFIDIGFSIVATGGTHKALEEAGIPSTKVLKISEGRPNIADLIKNEEIALVINTSDSSATKNDARTIRQSVLRLGIPYVTTVAAALVTADAIAAARERKGSLSPRAIQDYLA